MEDKIKVYVKINDNNEIIDICSSIFITDYSDWIYVDEGMGDKYAHAQGHYLDNSLTNEDGVYNYHYKNNKIVYVGE